MTLLPITLGLSEAPVDIRKAGGKPAGSSLFEISDDMKTRILERDDHTCRYCGFKSGKYQLVRAIKPTAKIDRDDDFATACIFCDQCFALDKVASMKSGVLVWLPEISQSQLHHLARALYVARLAQGPLAESARKILEIITARRDACKARLKTDDPAILSLVMREYVDPRAYNARQAKLEGVRLFPLDRRILTSGELEYNQFFQIVSYWRSKEGPFGDFQPTSWLEEYKALQAA